MNIDTVAAGGAVLVDWELYGSRITPDALRAALANNGYDPSIVPDIDQNREVRRVAHSWKQGRGSERYSSRVLFDDPSELIISVRVDTKAGRRNDQLQFATVLWDKVTKSWGLTTFDKPGEQGKHMPAVSAMKAKCDIARLHHDHQFIRPVLIQAPLRSMGAIPFIRRSGGAMIVPSQNIKELKRLQCFVNSIGDSYMGVVKADVTDSGTVKAMHRSVNDSLASEIASVRKDLTEWRARAERLPTGSIGERLSRFAEIRDKAQLYADALGMVTKGLLVDIGDAEEEARLLLRVAMGVEPRSALAAEASQAV